MKKVIIGVTGASGALYADILIKKIKLLEKQVSECCVLLTESAKDVWEFELQNEGYKEIHFKTYELNDFYAPVASGSAGYDLMIICPCSMATLGKIANGISNDLLTRAADVMLKERKKLILVTREMPLSLIHINNMKLVTEAGGIICPASPSFYSFPKDINEMAGTVVDKLLSLSGFETDSFKWGEKK
jgi:4-hydroxy-3-polyprenylbenzoate decarboxylase